MTQTLGERLVALDILQSELAAAIGVANSTVSHWARGLVRIPAEHVPKMAEVTGIPRHELRPDLWEPPHTMGNST